jgi:bifunctional ADP-heptose synthase (sugar kinase/adenylyltransferase)
VSHLRRHDVRAELRERILSDLTPVLDRIDLLIFSDFNYGCLPQALVDQIIAQARRRGVMAVADSQSSSQVGDVSPLHRTFHHPTER